MDNVVQFPNRKEKVEAEKDIDFLMNKLSIPLTSATYLTIVDGCAELRALNHRVISSSPVHKYEQYLLQAAVVMSAKVLIMQDALEKLGVNLEVLLNDDALGKVVKENYTRP